MKGSKNIESVKRKYEDRLLELPNVTIVATGKKDGKDVIKVFVTHKVPISELRPEEVVPKTLDEFETDVEESGVVTAQTNESDHLTD